VLTSNLGSQAIADANLDERQRKEAVLGTVQRHFKPEFLNRLDDVVVFHSLATEELTSIVDIQVARLGKRLAARRLTLEVTPSARDWLALNGFDPIYGARPLKRAIQQQIENPLAKEILGGNFAPGDTVHVREKKGVIAFAKA